MILGQPFETAFDLPPSTIQYKTYALDAILADLPTVPYQADALAEGLDIAGYDADGMIALAVVESYAADALAEAQVHENYSMSGRIKSDIHQFFYWTAGAVQKCNVRASYRMGGTISNVKYSPTTPQRTAFSAKQSLIVPEDINADDRFALADRLIAVASNKQNVGSNPRDR